jgi:transposase
LRVGVPHGHWKTTIFVAGLTTRGMIAPFVLDGPINRSAFEIYVEKVLVPELKPGRVVIMDNLSSHKGPKIRQLIEAAGASLLYLPPYSPDFNPIENAFAKLKALRRKPRSEPSPGYGPPSVSSSISSPLPNAKPISLPPDTMQYNRLPL